MDKLMELIERLEKATEGSRGLDIAIRRYLAGGPKDHWYMFNGKPTKDDDAANYTTSLDAALTLVPESLEWLVRTPDPRSLKRLYFAHVYRSPVVDEDDPEYGERPSFIGRAKTPALALCIAALKARRS